MILAIPVHHGLTPDDAKTIVEAIKESGLRAHGVTRNAAILNCRIKDCALGDD
jgi:hypothetical protein